MHHGAEEEVEGVGGERLVEAEGASIREGDLAGAGRADDDGEARRHVVGARPPPPGVEGGGLEAVELGVGAGAGAAPPPGVDVLVEGSGCEGTWRVPVGRRGTHADEAPSIAQRLQPWGNCIGYVAADGTWRCVTDGSTRVFVDVRAQGRGEARCEAARLEERIGRPPARRGLVC